jgi:hypothetical protein
MNDNNEKVGYILLTYNINNKNNCKEYTNIRGVYKTFSEATNNAKEELKKYYEGRECKDILDEVYFVDTKFSNGFRVVYKIYVNEDAFCSILEIKI